MNRKSTARVVQHPFTVQWLSDCSTPTMQAYMQAYDSNTQLLCACVYKHLLLASKCIAYKGS